MENLQFQIKDECLFCNKKMAIKTHINAVISLFEDIITHEHHFNSTVTNRLSTKVIIGQYNCPMCANCLEKEVKELRKFHSFSIKACCVLPIFIGITWFAIFPIYHSIENGFLQVLTGLLIGLPPLLFVMAITYAIWMTIRRIKSNNWINGPDEWPDGTEKPVLEKCKDYISQVKDSRISIRRRMLNSILKRDENTIDKIREGEDITIRESIYFGTIEELKKSIHHDVNIIILSSEYINR